MPSVFVIEQNGKIFWLYVAEVRAVSKTVLENLP